MHKDSLGDRMKGYYENRTRILLPRRTYIILRIDGKAFHNYTKDCQRPYDIGLIADMDTAAMALCENIPGAQFAFVQSDEISVLLTDFENLQTEAWFDNSLQKLVSLSASIATARFNQARLRRLDAGETGMPPSNDDQAAGFGDKVAYFDSRAFSIPDPVEVENYFIWRQQDATRNSISMTAQAYFAHERLQGKTSNEMQEMLWQEKGINWNDMLTGFKRGRGVVRNSATKSTEYMDKRTGETKTAVGVQRSAWEIMTTLPVFTQDRHWLQSHFPRINSV